MKMLYSIFLILLTVSAVLSQELPAEVKSIRLTGTIYDVNGFVMVGATLSASDSSGSEFKTLSGSDGTFAIELKPGIFALKVVQPGFLTLGYPEFLIVNSTKGYVSMDFVMFPGLYHSPCGYSGADCLPPNLLIEKYEVKVSPSLKQLYRDFGPTPAPTTQKKDKPE